MEVKKAYYRTTPQWFISMKSNNLKDKLCRVLRILLDPLNSKTEYKAWLRIDQIGVYQDKGHGEYH